MKWPMWARNDVRQRPPETALEKYWIRLWSAEETRTISAELVIAGLKTTDDHWAKYKNPGTSTAVIEGIKP